MNKKKIKQLKQSFFFKIILQFFLKKGNLNLAEKNMKLLFKALFLKTDLGNYSIILKIYKLLYINFEIKNIKKRKSFHIVPIPVTHNRRFFIITKWLFNAAYKDKQSISFISKLTTEIYKYINNEKSESLSQKTLSETTALKYRSNIHFRWY